MCPYAAANLAMFLQDIAPAGVALAVLALFLARRLA